MFIDSVQLAAELVHDAWLESGSFIRPRVRVSTEVHVPVAVESDADVVILLPDSWKRWDETKLRLVMLHEMCHVKRNDPATTLLACFATCIFWFHPLAWFLKRRLASLAEDAGDCRSGRTARSRAKDKSRRPQPSPRAAYVLLEPEGGAKLYP